jgi:hypothetical protein
VKGTSIVYIDEYSIPDTATNLVSTQIKAHAYETNGCWRNLYFELIKDNTFEYEVTAYGSYESSGACPDVMVYRDTVINFKPSQKGLYLFHIHTEPKVIKTDTMIVR